MRLRGSGAGLPVGGRRLIEVRSRGLFEPGSSSRVGRTRPCKGRRSGRQTHAGENALCDCRLGDCRQHPHGFSAPTTKRLDAEHALEQVRPGKALAPSRGRDQRLPRPAAPGWPIQLGTLRWVRAAPGANNLAIENDALLGPMVEVHMSLVEGSNVEGEPVSGSLSATLTKFGEAPANDLPPLPEPSSALLGATALATLAALARRRSRRQALWPGFSKKSVRIRTYSGNCL